MSTRNHEGRTVADSRLTVLVNSDPGTVAVEKALPDAKKTSRIRVLDECGRVAASAENLLVFSAASRLDQVVECVSLANKAHRLAALIVHNDVAPNWLPYVFHQSGLRALRNMIVHTDTELPTRILSAWAIGGERDHIADAAVINNELVVRSCAFEQYTVSFSAFPALEAIPETARSAFVLEEGGLLLHWPESQVHLDLEDIRFANDPEQQREARVAQFNDQKAIGAALRHVREEAGLKQSDIKGVSERQVRRVESGDRLTVDTLDAFARAIRVESNHLLERLADLVAEQEWPVSQSRVPVESSDRTPKPVAKTDIRPAAVRESDAEWYASPPPRELQLAADSSIDAALPRWSLDVDNKGSIHGFLEHDFRIDELVFVVESVRDLPKRPISICIVAWSGRFAEPLVSKPFVPKLRERISISSGQALVPNDVTKLEARVVNEP